MTPSSLRALLCALTFTITALTACVALSEDPDGSATVRALTQR